MEFNESLKERQEAIKLADQEFYRVKREKLHNERTKRGCLSDNELGRDAVNRASAAASRAKLVYLARDLELRTDRLEHERNMFKEYSNRVANGLRNFQENKKLVSDVFQALWELKDPLVCSILFESNIMHALHHTEEETTEIADSGLITTFEIPTRSLNRRRLRRSPAVDLSEVPPCSPMNSACREVPSLSDNQLSQSSFRFQSSIERSYASYVSSVSNQNRKQEHSTTNESIPHLKDPEYRARQRQTQFRASFPEDNRELQDQSPKRWYDAVRDIIRTDCFPEKDC